MIQNRRALSGKYVWASLGKYTISHLTFSNNKGIKYQESVGPDVIHGYDDVINWKQWRGALMISLICTRINGWVNSGEAGELRCHRAHYDVIIMCTEPAVTNTIIFWSMLY